MEKIQSAIAKARAARANPDATPVNPSLTRATVPVSQSATTAPATSPLPVAARLVRPAINEITPEVEAAWAALPTYVPNASLMKRNRILTYEGSHEGMAFDVMRTKLLQQMRANNWRRVAITSPTAHCGKSTVVLNLGFSLARQPEVRTIIAELDLRRPSLARSLGIRAEHSFGKVIAGLSPFEENAQRFGANLAFATNHTGTRNPAELLNSPSVSTALDEIETRFDPTLTIFDLPPMLINDDTIAFMGLVDCVLLVAAAETTTINEIDVCERDLAAQTNVLGVVLNKCRYVEQGYGYYD